MTFISKISSILKEAASNFCIVLNSFSISKCLVLFLVTLSLISFNLISNSGFLIKSVCAANLALKTSAAEVLK